MANDKEKKEYVKGMTPVGIAVYPYLNKPDDFGGKSKPQYKVVLRLSAEDSAELIEKLEPLVDEQFEIIENELKDKATNGKDGKAKASAKKSLEKLSRHYPWQEDVDAEGEPTGEWLFKFASNAEYEDSKGQQRKVTIPLFNGKKPTSVLIGGGSEIKIAYIVVPFHMPATDLAGISLRLDAVQVKKPVAPGAGGSSAEAYGFDDEGFEEEQDFDEDTGSGTSDGNNSSQEENEDF